ncbi:MAG: hypothetical protein M5U26_03205 [Planctomycetota bacterium]|nr:hypothetical protein [Planctomycetota bacterium]
MERKHFSTRFAKVWGIPALLLWAAPLTAQESPVEPVPPAEPPAAEEPAEPPAPETSKTIEIETAGEREVMVNEDGSTSIVTTVIKTNPETGASGTAQNVTNVQKTESGATYTRDTTAAGPHGGTAATHTDGTLTRNGDGSGSFSSTTTGNATGPNGRAGSWTTERAGEWARNEQGGRDASISATTTTANGLSSTVNRTGSSFQIDEHTKGFHGESERVNSLGGSTSRVTDGTVTKTESGREFESTTTGTHTFANGQEASWTTEREGSVTRNGDGTASYESAKTVTNAKGQEITVEKSGALSKNESGTGIQREGSTTVTGGGAEKKPPAQPAAASSAASAGSWRERLAERTAAGAAARESSTPSRGFGDDEARRASLAERMQGLKNERAQGQGLGLGQAREGGAGLERLRDGDGGRERNRERERASHRTRRR